jgi:hypothetical protein
LGLFALGTGAVGLWPSSSYVFDPAKGLTFAAALGAWLFAELFPEVRSSSSDPAGLDAHDTQFAKRLRTIATDDFLRFLDENDFGNSFRDKDMVPGYELPEFLRNASSAFNNQRLQSQLVVVRKEAEEFAHIIAYGSAPRNARAKLFIMIPENEPDGLWSQETEANVQAANRKADELSAAIKRLLELLRRKGLALAPPLAIRESDETTSSP